MTIVVDASVALKWYVDEEDSERALALLNSGERLIAPDLIVAELCTGAWRLIRRGELHPGQMTLIARSGTERVRQPSQLGVPGSAPPRWPWSWTIRSTTASIWR